MLAWFSRVFTEGRSDWGGQFERKKIGFGVGVSSALVLCAGLDIAATLPLLAVHDIRTMTARMAEL